MEPKRLEATHLYMKKGRVIVTHETKVRANHEIQRLLGEVSG